MRGLYFILCLLVSLISKITSSSNSSETIQKKGRCFLVFKESNVIDLNPLGTDRTVEKDKNFTLSEGLLVYNFCDNMAFKCNNVTGLMSYVYPNGTCYNVAGNIDELNSFEIGTTDSPLNIQLPLGDECYTNEFEKFNTSIVMSCNKNLTSGVVLMKNTTRFDVYSCWNTLYLESSDACVKERYYSLWAFMTQYNILCSVAMFLLGIYLNFLGAKYKVVTTCVIGFLASEGVGFTIVVRALSFITNGLEYYVFWIFFSVFAVSTLPIVFLLTKSDLIFNLFLGAMQGNILGSFIYNLIFSFLYPKLAAYWLTMIFCMIIFACLSIWVSKPLLIFSTSLLGSFLLTRGVSLLVNGFPSETVVIDLDFYREYDQMNNMGSWKTFIFLAGFLISSIIGVLVQYAINKTTESILLNLKNKGADPTQFLDEPSQEELDKKRAELEKKIKLKSEQSTASINVNVNVDAEDEANRDRSRNESVYSTYSVNNQYSIN